MLGPGWLSTQSGNEFVSGSGLSAHLALHRPDCFLSAHPDESDQTNRNSGPTKNMEDSTDCEIEHRLALQAYGSVAVCQNLVPLVNIKIAGKWMFIPLKMVLIGIDPLIHTHIVKSTDCRFSRPFFKL